MKTTWRGFSIGEGGGLKAGLTINEQGIIDNSSGVAAGLVLWSDIEAISVSQVMNQKFLMFIVKNPQYYITSIKVYE